MIIPKSRWNSLIVFSLFAACIFFMATFIYGIVAKTILLPEKKAEIGHLQSRVDVWKNRTIELEEYIKAQDQKYKIATRWSEFLGMMCDKDQKIRLGFVEDYVVKNKNLYKPIKILKKDARK